MSKKPLHRQWLDRALSNLERARFDRLSPRILYEDICYDCQQSVEKALKALMVLKNIKYQWVDGKFKEASVSGQPGDQSRKTEGKDES